ncbi:MAG TPA: FkbM family methyltransferase [bacterium]|nr:FkbM family methyltransferase [bacterium]
MCHKWPRIIYWRLMEKIRKSPAGKFLFLKQPRVLTDKNGMRFALYPWMTLGLKKLITKSHYADEFTALGKLIKKDDVVFDVGANAGVLSVYMSRLIGENGRLYAFEPIRETYYLLKENLALNRCENTRAENVALDSENGTKIMHCFEKNNSEWNSFGAPNFDGVTPNKKVEIRAETIDNYARQNKVEWIDFLKIDVEGFEREVLKGARRMLSEERIKYLSFEISQIPITAAGIKPKEVFDLLAQYGYQIYKFEPASGKFSGPYHDSDDFCLNFYAARNDLTKI